MRVVTEAKYLSSNSITTSNEYLKEDVRRRILNYSPLPNRHYSAAERFQRVSLQGSVLGIAECRGTLKCACYHSAID